MICPNCGAGNPDDNLVCTRCQLVFARQQRPVDYKTRPENPPIQDMPDHPLSPAEDPTVLYPENPLEEDELIPDVSQSRRPPAAIDTGVRYLPIAIGIIALGLLSIAGFLIMPEGKAPVESASDVYFAEAEQLYSEKNYLAAQKYYEQFIAAAPESPLAKLAESKIAEINQHFAPSRKIEVDSLLTKALAAFEKQRYVTPETDNVVIYTRRVLALDPQNIDARNIQTMIQNIYSRHVADAMEAKRYSEAEDICRKMLIVDPTSIEAQDALNKLSSLN
ncbi:MAG: hypothetical protein ACRBF0_11390 [Calditrichia bacterium]